MKILIIGGGGREHALAWKIARSPKVSKIFCTPGNGGISQIAECVAIKVSQIAELTRFAEQKQIDLTVVGSEEPLTLGIVDEFEKKGLKIFGPSAKAAEIEGSKVFAKQLMRKYHIPTAAFEVFLNPEEAKKFIASKNKAFVIKADGLAAGKGVIVGDTVEESLQGVDAIMTDQKFGFAGKQVVVEEKMEGEELSVFAVTDGVDYVVLPSAQDHKRIFDGDKGKNTGGMGAYAPAPAATEPMMKRIREEIIEPTIRGMFTEGRRYKGVLYCGLMLTKEGPKVVEFNCRFGDPECQVLMPLIKSDLVDLCLSTVEGKIKNFRAEILPGAAVCVVMASGGYPDEFEKGKEIFGLENSPEEVVAFHAGTEKRDGKFLTSGGRVLGVTAYAGDVGRAAALAYQRTAVISFDRAYYRKDIAHRALKGKS